MSTISSLYKIIFAAIIFSGLVYTSTASSLGSPSKVEIISDEEFFSDYDGQIIGFELTSNDFQAQEVHYSAEEVSNKLSGNVTENFTLKIESSRDQAVYKIEDSDLKPVRSVEYLERRYNWGSIISLPSQEERYNYYQNWARENCEDLTNDDKIRFRINEKQTGLINQNLETSLYCPRFGDIKAQVTKLESTPTEISQTTFSINNETFTLSNSDIEEGKTHATNNSLIQFKGSYHSGYNFPNTQNEYVAYDNNKFWIINRNRYHADYKNYLENAETQHLSQLIDKTTETERLEQQSRNQATRILQNYTQSELYANNSPDTSSFIQDGYLTLETNRSANYPSFQVWIKADQLNYYIPTTKYEVNYTNGKLVIAEGQTQRASVEVTNTGNESGDIQTKITDCSKNFSSPDTSQALHLEPRESKKVYLPITFSATNHPQQEIKGNCSLQSTNLNQPSKPIQKQEIKLIGTQTQQCEGKSSEKINSKLIQEYEELNYTDKGNYAIFKCQENNLTRKVQKICPSNKTVSSNYECIDSKNHSFLNLKPQNQQVSNSNEVQNCVLLSYEDRFGINKLQINNPVCRISPLYFLVILVAAITGLLILRSHQDKFNKSKRYL